MQRAKTFTLGLVVAAAAAGLAWWALHGDPDSPDEPEPVDVAAAGPVSGTLDPLRQRQVAHREPWPFREFEKDLLEARVPEQEEADLKRENELKVYFELVDVDYKDATIDEVVEDLNRQLKYTGVKIFTLPNSEMEGVRITLAAKDIEIQDLIGLLHQASQNRMLYYMTSQGLCFGSRLAVERCQIDAREALAKKRAERDRDDPILATRFRPDFADAWIGPVIRSIREQTGVQVVTDSAVWLEGKTLTWRADEMPLREALDRICAEMHCVYRVRNGRVFLSKP